MRETSGRSYQYRTTDGLLLQKKRASSRIGVKPFSGKMPDSGVPNAVYANDSESASLRWFGSVGSGGTFRPFCLQRVQVTPHLVVRGVERTSLTASWLFYLRRLGLFSARISLSLVENYSRVFYGKRQVLANSARSALGIFSITYDIQYFLVSGKSTACI